MNAAVYWRSALGLFWSFMFFVLLALVISISYLGSIAFYPYAIFMSAILILFLTAFLLFDKRIKAGLYMCLILSSLFVFNQVLTLYFLFVQPSGILPMEMIGLLGEEAALFPLLVSSLLLLWGLFLLLSTWKSKPVFEKERSQEQLRWLIQLRREKVSPAKAIAKAKQATLKKP